MTFSGNHEYPSGRRAGRALALTAALLLSSAALANGDSVFIFDAPAGSDSTDSDPAPAKKSSQSPEAEKAEPPKAERPTQKDGDARRKTPTRHRSQ